MIGQIMSIIFKMDQTDYSLSVKRVCSSMILPVGVRGNSGLTSQPNTYFPITVPRGCNTMQTVVEFLILLLVLMSHCNHRIFCFSRVARKISCGAAKFTSGLFAPYYTPVTHRASSSDEWMGTFPKSVDWEKKKTEMSNNKIPFWNKWRKRRGNKSRIINSLVLTVMAADQNLLLLQVVTHDVLHHFGGAGATSYC